jgi:hypothetical protein
VVLSDLWSLVQPFDLRFDRRPAAHVVCCAELLLEVDLNGLHELVQAALALELNACLGLD